MNTFNGLANLGNTCYLNSCIQVILRMELLNDYLSQKRYEKHLKNIPESLVLVEWDNLRDLMFSNQNCVVAPNAYVQAIQRVAAHKNREIFTGMAQNDMPEFLLFFMECLHNAVSRHVNMRVCGNEVNAVDKLATRSYMMMKEMFEKDYSEMVKFFYCIQISVLNEVDCPRSDILINALSVKPEPQFILYLPIPSSQSVTLYDCLDNFCRAELMEGENAWWNEKTNKKQTVQKTTMFWSLPNYMVISLKRFNERLQKLNTMVDFPLTNADFAPYVCGYNRDSYVYDAFGVCEHVGNVGGGHYTCKVLGEDTVWREINDTSIRLLQNNTEVVTPNAYCIFYRKRETPY